MRKKKVKKIKEQKIGKTQTMPPPPRKREKEKSLKNSSVCLGD